MKRDPMTTFTRTKELLYLLYGTNRRQTTPQETKRQPNKDYHCVSISVYLTMSEPLTAAELIRRKRRKLSADLDDAEKEKAKTSEEEGSEDLDERIRRLEEELKQQDSDSDTSSSDDGEESEGPLSSQGNNGDGAMIFQSALVQDRIEPLPSNKLPSNKRKRIKAIDKEEQNEPSSKHNKGLEAAVKEVLSGYVARSSERLPFYCRVCAHQYNNETEFFEHKKTEFHKTAAEMERKASYCKLCRKQLTSPVQLKEHLKSRPHRERLESRKQAQQNTHRRRGNFDSKGRQWT